MGWLGWKSQVESSMKDDELEWSSEMRMSSHHAIRALGAASMAQSYSDKFEDFASGRGGVNCSAPL